MKRTRLSLSKLRIGESVISAVPKPPERLLKEGMRLVRRLMVPHLLSMVKDESKKTALAKKYKVKPAPLKDLSSVVLKVTGKDIPQGSLIEDPTELTIYLSTKQAREAKLLGYYTKLSDGSKAIVLLTPYNVRDLDEAEIELFLSNYFYTLWHELMHFVQFSTNENIGGLDAPGSKPDYFLSDTEFKPWIVSSVGELLHELKMMDSYEIKPSKLNFKQFIGEIVYTPSAGSVMGKIPTSEFFLKLKKNSPEKWKRAINDLISLLRTTNSAAKYLSSLGL